MAAPWKMATAIFFLLAAKLISNPVVDTVSKSVSGEG